MSFCHRPVDGRWLPRDCLIRKILIYSEQNPEMQKTPVIANEGFAQTLVARGGIEPG